MSARLASVSSRPSCRQEHRAGRGHPWVRLLFLAASIAPATAARYRHRLSLTHAHADDPTQGSLPLHPCPGAPLTTPMNCRPVWKLAANRPMPASAAPATAALRGCCSVDSWLAAASATAGQGQVRCKCGRYSMPSARHNLEQDGTSNCCSLNLHRCPAWLPARPPACPLACPPACPPTHPTLRRR